MFKRNIIPIFILIIIIIFVMDPQIVSQGAFNGLKIWVNNLIPFLFPMSILSNILLQYNFLYSLLEKFSFVSEKLFKSKFAFIPYFISFISGYPSGAMSINMMGKSKKINSDESNYLLLFTNICSFQFISGAVIFSMLKDYNLLKFIVFPHFLGAIFLSFLYKNTGCISYKNSNFKLKTPKFNEVFNLAISKSITGILTVGGVIVIFSVLSAFLTHILSSFYLFSYVNSNIQEIILSLVIGSLEMTNGCNIIASSANIPIEVKLIIINFLISFSGLSIVFQTMAVTQDINFKISYYMKGKFIFAVLSSFICVIMLMLL